MIHINKHRSDHGWLIIHGHTFVAGDLPKPKSTSTRTINVCWNESTKSCSSSNIYEGPQYY